MHWYLFVTKHTLNCTNTAVFADQGEIDKHLQLGKKYLQEGQLSEALFHYSAAVGE